MALHRLAFSIYALVSVLAAVTLHWCSSLYTSWKRLRHVPGPPGAGWTKWWLLRNTLSGNMHLELKKATEEYAISSDIWPKKSLVDLRAHLGPLVRVGPNTLVTNDPDVLRRMWAVRSQYKKSDWYDAVRWDPSRDNLINMKDDEQHATLRNKMAAGYSGKENENLESTIDSEIMDVIGLIERKYTSDEYHFQPVDIATISQYFTLDVITSLAFGRNFGHIKNDADVYSYVKITEDSMPIMLMLTIFPFLTKILQSRLMRGLLPSEKDPAGFGRFISVAKQVVAERLASDNPYRKDMLGSFLAHGLTREEAEGETLTQVIAGSDTTATAIRTTLLYIVTSPRCYDSLVSEIRDAAAKGTISAPIKDSEAKTLPYLQAVIREGLRVLPPVAGLMSKVVPKGGDELCGFQVPEGTDVGVSMLGLQHSQEIYGEDAAMFRPERWLEAQGDRLKTMTTTWELTFKYGKWQCLGKSVALIELNKIFVELLRRYDLALVDPINPISSFNAGIYIQHGMNMRITRSGP